MSNSLILIVIEPLLGGYTEIRGTRDLGAHLGDKCGQQALAPIPWN